MVLLSLIIIILLIFQAGIGKLTEARESVSNMQKKAAKKSKLLAEKQTDADMALKAISQSMTVCSKIYVITFGILHDIQ